MPLLSSGLALAACSSCLCVYAWCLQALLLDTSIDCSKTVLCRVSQQLSYTQSSSCWVYQPFCFHSAELGTVRGSTRGCAAGEDYAAEGHQAAAALSALLARLGQAGAHRWPPQQGSRAVPQSACHQAPRNLHSLYACHGRLCSVSCI